MRRILFLLLVAVAGCGPTYGGEPPDGSGLELPPPPADEAAAASAPAEAAAEPAPAATEMAPAAAARTPEGVMFKGLRTAAYHVEDLAAAKAWYAAATGVAPYFDEPFYVGFNVGGYELGLVPVERGQAADAGRVVVYWGVEDIDAALAHLLELGAQPNDAIQDVGDGVKVATVRDPFGNVLGIIENPYFSLPEDE